jgi:ribosome-associated protein
MATTPAGRAIQVVLSTLEDAKAEDIVTIDIQNKSALGDCMIITSGRSHRHVSAIADRLVAALKEAGAGPVRVEGLPHCDWVLIDAGDLIIHVFRPEVREFYNLEKMWMAEPYSERRAHA